MNPIADLLTRAKARTLAHPCRGTLCRDTDGEPVHSECPTAVCWCAVGAIYREVNGDYDLADSTIEKLHMSARRLTGMCAGKLNDLRPDLIPQMFDLAIEEASK